MTLTAYTPLPRKYRPQRLQDLVGQEAIAKALGQAITQGRISHAYLFTGPRGTGKTSSARILAKSLNCESGPTVTPCLVCPQCESIASGNALDVIEFDAASNNSVDNARELIESTQFRPMHGRYKIYIIDEVHMLSNAAFNALLKTLEEPPDKVIFIFATTEVHKVLPTIISRCQRFDFQSVATPTITGHLHYLQTQEGFTLEPEATRMIARLAKGGMRDALSLLDQVALLAKEYAPNPLPYTLVAELLGQLPEHEVLQLSEGILTQRPEQVLQVLHALQSRGLDAYRIQRALLQHWRAMMLLMYADKGETLKRLSQTLELEETYANALKEQLQCCSPQRLSVLLQQTAHLETQLRHTQDPLTWLESTLVKFAFEEHFLTLNALQKRIEHLEAMLSSPSQLVAPQRQGMIPPQAASPSETLPQAQALVKPLEASQQGVAHAVPSAVPVVVSPVIPNISPVAVSPVQPSSVERHVAHAPLPQVIPTIPQVMPSVPLQAQPRVTPTSTMMDASLPQVTLTSVPTSFPASPQEAMAHLSPHLPVTIRPIITQQTRLVEASPAGLVFECRSMTHQQTLLNPNKQLQIAAAIQKAFGHAIPWRLTLQASQQPMMNPSAPAPSLPMIPVAQQGTVGVPVSSPVASPVPAPTWVASPSFTMPQGVEPSPVALVTPALTEAQQVLSKEASMPLVIPVVQPSVTDTVGVSIAPSPMTPSFSVQASMMQQEGLPTSMTASTQQVVPQEDTAVGGVQASSGLKEVLASPPVFVNERQLEASKKLLLEMFKGKELDISE
ncbi:MAG: DNA polymerase III subunit gamma/tau [Vampirovibrionales bacterium]